MKKLFTKKIAIMSGYLLIGTLLQCVFFSLISAESIYAQKQSLKDIRINLKVEGSVVEVLKAIEAETEFRFSLNHVQINENKKITLEANAKSLQDILEKLSSEYNLAFKRINKSIHVSRLTKKSEPVTEQVLWEQAKEVTGSVKSAEDNAGLPGVNILIKGTTIGTVTDVNGNFKINVPSPDVVLVFSSIGYVSEEIVVSNQSVIDLVLVPDIKALEEIVVVGYGTVKKSDLTGSVASVTEKQLRQTMVTSIDQALQGRAAGMDVTQSSGQPGGGVSVRIRGVGSITATNEPLYIVDGIPISGNSQGTAEGFDWAGGGNGQTAVNGLSAINPNDIVSIEVLKDASATAIYGSRASNGVVIITTRRGQSGATKVTYDGYYGVQSMPKKLDVLDLRGYAEFHNQLSVESGNTPRAEFGDPSVLGKGTDWQDEIFDVAPMQNHNIAISGGNEVNTYSLSAGYMNQEGIVIGSGFDRLSARLSIDNNPKTWLKMGGSFSLGSTSEKITLNDDDSGVISLALNQTPDIPVQLPGGGWGGSTLPENTRLNPVAVATIRDLSLERTRVLANLYADVTLAKGLIFRTKFGSDINNTKNYAFNPTYQMGNAINNQSQSRRSFNNNLFWIFSNYLTYSNSVGSNISTETMLGFETQESNYEGMTGGRKNFVTNYIQELDAGDAETAYNSQYKGSSSLTSYFGRVNFTFFDRYLFTATYRADGSSKFGPNYKFAYFPSFALAWKVSNESFMNSISKIEELKLRIGYGKVGNQEIGNYTYGSPLLNRETKWGSGYISERFANPDVRWESTASYNVGLNLSLFESRLEIVADAYIKKTQDLLMPMQLPLYMGTSGQGSISPPMINIGELENRGFELTINSVNITSPFTWNSSLNFSMNRNEITALNSENTVIDRNVQWFNHVTRSAVGQPIGQYYGYVVEGIFQNAEDIENHAEQHSKGIDRQAGVWIGDLKFKDLDKNGKIDVDDRTFIGNPNPKAILGLNNSFSYKGFDLSFYIISKLGHELFNYGRRNTESMFLGFNQLATVSDRATVALKESTGSIDDINDVYLVNPNTNMPRAVSTDPNANRRISDRYVEDGSFVRIKNLTFGYNLPSDLLSRMSLTNARVYINLQNFLTFTKYTGFDPEIGPYNQDPLLTGIDNGNYPLPKIYSLGLNLSF